MGDKGEGGVKNLKKWAMSFMGGPQTYWILETSDWLLNWVNPNPEDRTNNKNLTSSLKYLTFWGLFVKVNAINFNFGALFGVFYSGAVILFSA